MSVAISIRHTATDRQPLFLRAEWRSLALVNYRIPSGLLEPYVPAGVELETTNGYAFVSLVGFMFCRTRVFGLAIPGHCNFEEVNLRFYVVRKVENEIRRGVVFIKELVPRLAVSIIARHLYNENYYTVAMRHHIELDPVGKKGPEITYEFKADNRWNRIYIATEANHYLPDLDSHEASMLEHYWGYSTQKDGGTIEYRVDHPRWNVWNSTASEIDCDFELLYGDQLGSFLTEKPYSVFVAEGSPITVSRPLRI
jgi:uncharacterized protein YqjF (DUF2071 family)